MKTGDIMTKEVIAVDPNMRIEKVAGILTKNRIHGVPVIEKNKVVGIITETDFFVKDSSEIYLPSFISFIKKTKFNSDLPKDKKDEFRKLLKTKAKDIMTADCFTISPEMEAAKLLNTFKKTGFHTLPVVNESGLLCGIITLADIISIMGDLE